MLVAVAMAAALNAACEKPAAVAPPPPPEVYVAAVVQQDVPVYLDLVGQTAGIPGRRDPGAGRRLPRHRELPRGIVRPQGRSPLSDRPEAARGDARAGEAAKATEPIGDRPGAAREGQQRRRALHAARRQAGGQPAGAGQRAGRAGRRGRRSTRVAGRRGQGRGGKGDARSRLRADHVADQRAGRHDPGEGRAASSDAARARC